MVRLFVPGRPGTFLVGCVGADLAVLQALLLIEPPVQRSALLSALHSCWASCPCSAFLLVSAFTSFPAALPFCKSPLGSVLEA